MSNGFNPRIDLSGRSQGRVKVCIGFKPTHGYMWDIGMSQREVHLEWPAVKPLMQPDDRVAATMYRQEEVLTFGAP
jgi:hypothetical protein